MTRKKLTLEQTWKQCLRMWRDIVKEWKKDKQLSIRCVKSEWLAKNDPDASPAADCYFCEYALQHDKSCEGVCTECPARLVSRAFECENYDYHFYLSPDKFLCKLEQLNKERKSKTTKHTKRKQSHNARRRTSCQ